MKRRVAKKLVLSATRRRRVSRAQVLCAVTTLDRRAQRFFKRLRARRLGGQANA